MDKSETILGRASEFADRCALSAEKPDTGARNLSLEFTRLREAGFLGVALPRELGGNAWGVEPGTWRHLLRLLKIIGRGNLSVGRIYEGHVNALQLILQWGDPTQIESAAADVLDGCLFGVWNTEAPNDGLTLAEVAGGAQRFRLSGAKTFASGASIIQRVFANAATLGGWQMCLVALDRVKVECDTDSWQPLGMRATESIRVNFDGVELDRAALIGEPGDYLREPWFSGGAIRFAAVQLGGAEAIAEASRHFLQQENRIEDPHQAIRAGEVAALLETGNLWLEGAASRAEAATVCPDELVAYAGLMRRTIERIGLEVIEHAVRSSGARALLRPNTLERLVRDLVMYLRQPAPDFVLERAGKFTLKSEAHYDTLWKQPWPRRTGR
ncbi:MAG: acyl-CoA dehydrogenase family protein [Chthoniobacterales bacterium]